MASNKLGRYKIIQEDRHGTIIDIMYVCIRTHTQNTVFIAALWLLVETSDFTFSYELNDK
jgi:hypothetical protein